MHPFLALALLSLGQITTVLADDPLAECFGDRAPSWTDCDILVDKLGWEGNWDSWCNNGQLGQTVTAKDEGNCMVTFVFTTDLSVCSMPFDVMLTVYESVLKPQCRDAFTFPLGARYYDSDVGYFEFVNNPDYHPSAARITVKNDTGEYLVEVIPADVEEDASAGKEVKRQQPGDNNFDPLIIAHNVESAQFRREVGPELPAGSSYHIEQSDSVTVGVETSVEMGASFWDIFSTSVGVSVSSSTTTTSTVGVDIYYDCSPGQSGQLFWYPEYLYVVGTFEPSGDEVTVWSPEGSGAYRVDCRG